MKGQIRILAAKQAVQMKKKMFDDQMQQLYVNFYILQAFAVVKLFSSK